ncbi:MAG: uracil phosphoribosyltransferase [archaeon]
MNNCFVLDNPALQEVLNELRDKNTGPARFRQGLKRAGYLMTYEMLDNEVRTAHTEIETPMGPAEGISIDTRILQIYVMRAGEPFGSGGTDLLDDIGYNNRDVGIVDAKRVSNGGLDMEVEFGTIKVPPHDENTIGILYDPMLATATTMIATLRKLKERGLAKRWIVCSLLASPYGLERLADEFPNLHVYTLSIDRGGKDGLNDKGYIIPGLGDAGDRAFGTYE